MNYPGNPSGNWSWRMNDDQMNEFLSARLRDFNLLYGRMNPLIALEPVKPFEEEPVT
jgi:4-alpha-glucanotransferase